MRRILAVVVLLTSPSCKSKWWTEQRASEVEMGSFVVTIPDGWRSAAELRNIEKSVAKFGANGVTVLLPEDFDVDKPRWITLQWESASAFLEMTCDQIAPGASLGNARDVSSVTEPDGDRTCRWRNTVAGEAALVVTRFSDDHMLIIGCRRTVSIEADLDTPCAELVRRLKHNVQHHPS